MKKASSNRLEERPVSAYEVSDGCSFRQMEITGLELRLENNIAIQPAYKYVDERLGTVRFML